MYLRLLPKAPQLDFHRSMTFAGVGRARTVLISCCFAMPIHALIDFSCEDHGESEMQGCACGRRDSFLPCGVLDVAVCWYSSCSTEVVAVHPLLSDPGYLVSTFSMRNWVCDAGQPGKPRRAKATYQHVEPCVRGDTCVA